MENGLYSIQCKLLGNNSLALRCFQEQLDRAQELKDKNGEAQVMLIPCVKQYYLLTFNISIFLIKGAWQYGNHKDESCTF